MGIGTQEQNQPQAPSLGQLMMAHHLRSQDINSPGNNPTGDPGTGGGTGASGPGGPGQTTGNHLGINWYPGPRPGWHGAPEPGYIQSSATPFLRHQEGLQSGSANTLIREARHGGLQFQGPQGYHDRFNMVTNPNDPRYWQQFKSAQTEQALQAIEQRNAARRKANR